MGAYRQVSILGSAAVQPLLPTSQPFPSLTDGMSLNLQQTRSAVRSDETSVNTPALSPLDLLAGLQITAVRFFSLRVVGGTCLVSYQSPAFAGTMQVPVSDLLVLSNPLSGSEITSLLISGNANVEYIIAGDQ